MCSFSPRACRFFVAVNHQGDSLQPDDASSIVEFLIWKSLVVNVIRLRETEIYLPMNADCLIDDDDDDDGYNDHSNHA